MEEPGLVVHRLEEPEVHRRTPGERQERLWIGQRRTTALQRSLGQDPEDTGSGGEAAELRKHIGIVRNRHCEKPAQIRCTRFTN